MEKTFRTKDIFLAAYLQFRNIPVELEVTNGRVDFLFPQSETLFKVLAAYHSNDAVPLSTYLDTYKTLKAEMFSARLERAIR